MYRQLPPLLRIGQGSLGYVFAGKRTLGYSVGAARLLWEREAQVRAVALGKPGKPWESWADSTFPLAGNWSKIGVDHMFDHNWKISYPGVAQLVARLLWEQDAGSSSLPTRTKIRQNLLILADFS